MLTLSPQMVRQIAAFRGMTDEEIQQLLDIAEECEFASGEVVLREGKPSQNAWIVLEGECAVFKNAGDDDRTTLATLGPGSIFGEMSFFSPAPHSASVRADSDLRVVRISRAGFDRLIESGQLAAYKFAYNTLRVVAERLRRMDERFAELVQECGDDHQMAEWRQLRSKLYGDWNI